MRLRPYYLLIAVSLSSLLLNNASCARSAPESSFRWAERLLTESRAVPGSSYVYDYDWSEAAEAFQSILRKYGPIPRACIGLARSQMLLGNYDGAVDSCRRALALWPRWNVAQREIETAQQCVGMAADARKLMGERNILQVEKYPVNARIQLWLVLSAKVTYDTERQRDSNSNVRLTLVRADQLRFDVLWRSDPLGPGYTDGQFDYVHLYVADLTGDGSPEALITEGQVGAWWEPSHLDVFGVSGKGMVHELGVSSQEPLTIEDIDGDGSYEVRNYRFVGFTMFHGDEPIWFDVFAYRNGTYQMADGDFRWMYHDLAATIRRKLLLHPEDYELWERQGRLCEMLRRPQAARRAYWQAESLLKSAIDEETNADFRAELSRLLRDVRARTRAL
jgi:hypothetical protein